MKVFISWSGEVSHQVALVLEEWLPSVINAVKPYVSSEMDKGTRWQADIARELDESNCGIICVTQSNDKAPWLNFEAGAISKSVEEGRVLPFLFRVKRTEIQGPIKLFQSTVYDKQDVKKLVHNLYEACEPSGLTQKGLNSSFNKWWPTLKKKLDKIQDEFKEKKALEKKQLSLRATLEKTSSILRSKKVSAPKIQDIVMSIVRVWSEAAYDGQQKPPPPTDVLPLLSGIKLECKLCGAKHKSTTKLCCTNCGLFCSGWLREAEE